MKPADLPQEPLADSPVFRASLSALDHRTHAVKSACKTSLLQAVALQELLAQVDQAEDELYRSLSALGCSVDGDSARRDGSADESPFDLEGFRAWKAKRRQEEMERLNTLVIARLRGLRSDIKTRGTGGGGALSKFEVSTTRPVLRFPRLKTSPLPCPLRKWPKRTIRPCLGISNHSRELQPPTWPLSISDGRRNKQSSIFNGTRYTRTCFGLRRHTVQPFSSLVHA
jgi:hypothetical protein